MLFCPWLLKTEPGVFSIDDLASRQCEAWDGVRNYQARNYLRDSMRDGDSVLIYHSSCQPSAIVGQGRVRGEAFADASQFDPASPYFDSASKMQQPRWFARMIAYEGHFPRPLTLAELRSWPIPTPFALLARGNRLSVLPVPAVWWDQIQAWRQR
jgi:predicted RNA-binding protein with PUA-like domain